MYLRMKKSRPRKANKSSFGDKWINNGEHIAEILASIKKEHILLKLTLPDEATTFSTTLLEIFPEQNRLALDTIMPREANSLLLNGMDMHLNTSLDGAIIDFDSRLMETGKESGITFYRIEMPAVIRYRQRRRFLRAKIPGSAGFHAENANKTKQHFNGCIHDISESGAGVVLDGLQAIETGDQLSRCSATLPHIGEVSFNIEVRFVIHNPQQQTTRVGGCFIDIERTTRNRIQQLIQQMEPDIPEY